MSDALNAIVEKLSAIPDLSGLGEVIEAIRSAYDVDHVYYYALSLGLDAPVFVETKGGGMSHDAGIWRRDGRSLGALSYSSEWITVKPSAALTTFDKVTIPRIQELFPAPRQSAY